MGRYNPNIPRILGQEWVPIRDESPQPDQALEIGHTFVTDTSQTISQGRFYLSTDTFNLVGSDNPTFLMSLYPIGTEVEVGPIERVVVPVQSGSISGDGSIAGTIQQALATPANMNGTFGVAMVWSTVAGTTLTVNFGTMAYQTLLYDKRILGLNLLMTSCGTFPPNYSININNASGMSEHIEDVGFGTCTEAPNIKVTSLYEVTPHWQTTGTYPSDLQPWRWSELRRFDTTGGAPTLTTTVIYGGGTPPDAGASAKLGYMALEIWYCKETRVAVGARENGLDGVAVEATTIVPLRNSSLVTPVTITPGEYTLTVCLTDFAGFDNSAA